jgi:hypothetical protein
LPCLRPHEPTALQALGRRNCFKIVEFRNRPGTCWEHHPRLLRGCENVNVRRAQIGVVQGADAGEPNSGTGLRVVAPNRDPASRAAGYLLALAARRGCPDEFWLTSGVHDTIGFIESVARMRGAGLALAPTAMTSMNNQGRSDQTISDLSACTSALHAWLHQTDCIVGYGHTRRSEAPWPKARRSRSPPPSAISNRLIRSLFLRARCVYALTMFALGPRATYAVQ